MVISGRKQDIPHIIPLLHEGDKSELLVTIAGRQPKRAFSSRIYNAFLSTLCAILSLDRDVCGSWLVCQCVAGGDERKTGGIC